MENKRKRFCDHIGCQRVNTWVGEGEHNSTKNMSTVEILWDALVLQNGPLKIYSRPLSKADPGAWFQGEQNKIVEPKGMLSPVCVRWTKVRVATGTWSPSIPRTPSHRLCFKIPDTACQGHMLFLSECKHNNGLGVSLPGSGRPVWCQCLHYFLCNS